MRREAREGEGNGKQEKGGTPASCPPPRYEIMDKTMGSGHHPAPSTHDDAIGL